MNKKDFELIANVILGLDISKAKRRMIAEDFAIKLQHTSSRFNRLAFLKACGYFL